MRVLSAALRLSAWSPGRTLAIAYRSPFVRYWLGRTHVVTANFAADIYHGGRGQAEQKEQRALAPARADNCIRSLQKRAPPRLTPGTPLSIAISGPSAGKTGDIRNAVSRHIGLHGHPGQPGAPPRTRKISAIRHVHPPFRARGRALGDEESTLVNNL